MGNVFMRKSEDVFKTAENFQKKYQLKKDYDFLVVDLHCETTSEKMAMGLSLIHISEPTRPY